MGCRVGTPLRLSLMLSVPVWCAMVAQASAACTNSPPANNQTVDCSGTGNAAVVAPTGVTGVTVNVPGTASITGVAQTVAGTNAQYSSVLVNDNSTVNNAGTISPTLPGTNKQRDYVGVNLNGSNTTLVNTGTISVTNPANTVTNPGSTTYRLYGVISSSGTAATFDNVMVENRGNITISQSGTGVARGIYSGEGINSMVVENFGMITVTRVGGAVNTTAVGGVDSDDDTDSLTVNNHQNATIKTSGTNTFSVGGRAQDYSLTNDGTITNTGGRGALVFYGGADDGSAQTTIVNSKTGVITGNVVVSDGNPLGSATALGAIATTTEGTRDSSLTNAGTITGSVTLASGAHTIDNSGTITGPISVFQTAAVGVGAATFTLTNSGMIGGDITITDRADSVNAITLQGTGFSGNVIAVNGTGSNTLTLDGVTNLASVRNFTNLNLRASNVTVTNGVSLVDGATIRTRIVGQGGTRAAPSTSLGTINGTLTLAGSTTVIPTFARMTRNGDVYQLASAVNGAGTSDITVQQSKSALVKVSADTSDGRLLLVSHVRDARTIPGISQQGGATLQGLLSYNGNNPQVYRLGALVEGLHSIAQVRAAGEALAPITNGADVQTPINAAMLFHQQIDSRLDSFVYAQIPSNGRSADLGVSRPAPVYGVLPTSGAWIEGIGGGVHQGSVGGASAYDASLVGVIGGYDRLIVPGLRFGGAFGFIDGRVNGNSNFVGNREDIQTYQGLAYATWEQPNYYLRGSVGYGGVNYQSAREIGFANFSDTAFGSHSGDIFTTRGEVGVPYEYLSSLLVPYAAFTYSHLEQNAYTETSSAGAAFAYQSARNNSERSEVGGKIVVPLTEQPMFSYLFPTGSVVALEGRAAYVHEFGNVAQTVSAAFTGGGNVFVAAGPVPNRDMVDYGVGLRMGSGRVQVDLQYDGLARSNFYQQVGLLRARFLF